MRQDKKKEKNTVKNKVKTTASSKDPKTTVQVSEKSLSTFITAVEGCNEQAILHINPNELRVAQVDIGNVYMIIASCECKTTFEKEAPTKVGVDFALLKKTLMHAKGSTVTLEISKTTIEVAYGRFTAKIPVVDIGFIRKEPNPPVITLETTFEIPGKYLADACKMVSKSGGRVYVYVKNKVVFLAATEGDLCIREVVGTVNKPSVAKSLFSNDYLSLIVKSVKDVSVKCEISKDHPIKMTAEKEGCVLEFILAPRIEAD